MEKHKQITGMRLGGCEDGNHRDCRALSHGSQGKYAHQCVWMRYAGPQVQLVRLSGGEVCCAAVILHYYLLLGALGYLDGWQCAHQLS